MLRSIAMCLALILAGGAAFAGAINESSFSREARTQAQEMVIPRLATPPVIDGDVSEDAWKATTPVKAFWLAGTTEVAQDQTITWAGFDSEYLYIAWACRDVKVVSNQVKHDDNGVWKQDAVELFLSPERDGATERQFILSSSGAMFDRRPGKEYGEDGRGWNPKWDGKVKRQPWGYTAEMRIPLAELVDTKKYPVGRGTVWTMKLTRHDRGEFQGTRTSSWTRIGGSTGDRRAGGKLVFEESNLISNGDAEKGDGKGGLVDWGVQAAEVDVAVSASTEQKTQGNQSAAIRVSGKKNPKAQARVNLGGGPVAGATVETTYAFTADIKAESADETLVAYLVAFQDGKTEQINFKHNAGWQKVRVLLTAVAGDPVRLPVLQAGPVAHLSTKEEGGGTVYIDNVRLEIVDAEEIGLDPESVCLTGNAVDAYRTRNKQIPGTYTYTDPMTNDPWFPHYFLPGTGPEQDYGKYRGHIPFSKGRLTDGQTVTSVNWPAFWGGHHGQDITFDLQKEYEITRVVVKSSWIGQRMSHLMLKSPGEVVYTLVASVPDKVAFKTTAPTGEEMERLDQRVFNGINQSARWVRVQVEARSPAQFSEVEIWGKDISNPGSLKRIAYLQSGGATPVANPTGTPEPKREVPILFPIPQEMKLDGAAVALKDGMLIEYEPVKSERAKITAEVLRDELNLCFGLKATVAPAASGGKGAILVGEAGESPVTAAALAELKQTVTKDAPGKEGYVLAARDGRIVIGGSDARGAFYGVQSLLTLTRAASGGGFEVPGVMVRDWPDMKMRIIEGRAVPSQNLVRALARFRVNYYTPKVINIAKAAEHDAFAERYFVSFIPFLDFNSTVLMQDQSLTERPATERLEDVPMDSRRNANPGKPRTWEIYFAELDKWLPKFHGDILYIGMDETHHYGAGSRWNVSPESRALKMSAGPLLAYTINKIDKKAKQYGKRVFMHDTPFCRDHMLSYPGDPDPSWRKALPLLPKDVMFNVWHWNKKWVLDPLGKEHGFDLVYLCTGDRDWREPAMIDPNDDVMPFEFPGYFKGMNNYMAESSFTASKLLETVGVAWNTKAVRPKDPSASAAVARYVLLWNQLHLGEPIPPSLVARAEDFTPVDIASAANRSRIDEVAYDGKGWVDMGPNVDLRALKPGVSTFAGVPFKIIDEAKNAGNSVVMAQNSMYTDKVLPDTVEVSTPGLKASSLVFLHCLDNAPGWNYLRRRELAGYYFMVLEDGTYSKVELKYGTSIGTWDGLTYKWEYAPAGDAMTYATRAWTGQTMSGMEAKLYQTEWVNPKPNLKIEKIILRTTFEPSNMNPMLLAVTAVAPGLAGATSTEKLRSAAELKPAKPVGVAYDLSGGKDESEKRYIAPDGTVIEAKRMDNALSERTSSGTTTNDYRSYVGKVTFDGSQAARTDALYFTFAKPTQMTGVMVTGRFREQRKAANFPPMRCNLFVDVSEDGGATWKEVGAVNDTIPEEHGPVWFAMPKSEVRHVRVRFSLVEGSPDFSGFNRVQFFREP
jgi:hypothetical protein